jgi:hypothetical protein
MKQKNIFCKSGNKTESFILRSASVRASLRRKEELLCASYGTTDVVP